MDVTRAALLLLVVAAVGGCRSAPTSVQPGRADAKGSPMIETLHELIALLQTEVTAEQVIARLGTPGDESLSLHTTNVTPRIAGVAAASVSVYPDGGAVYLAELRLAQPASLSVADLTRAFGPFRQSRSEPEMPRELSFERAQRGAKWAVVVLARVEAGSAALDGAALLGVTLRRDPAQ